MIHDIEERLENMGLSKSPFLNYDAHNPDFSKVFVDRTKELYKINLALEYYKSQSNRNLAFVGPSRIGKTTLLQYTIMQVQDQFRCLYFEYPVRFNEFCQKCLDFFGNGISHEPLPHDSHDLGNLLITRSGLSAGNTVIIIDNFEDMLSIPSDEVDGFIRLFRRAKCLFILACTEREWSEIQTRFPKMKYAFAEELYIPPFSVKNCVEFFESRISLARMKASSGLLPFTEESIKVIGIYSFFIPGRMNDLANKVLFEALTEDIRIIQPDFIRGLILSSPVQGPYLAGLTDKEIQALESMIEQNRPISFEDLAELLGVSRVAAAGYFQKLLERKVVFQMVSPGKKRIFHITDTFRNVLV